MISEGKSWQTELPKILILYRASPHPISGKLPAMLLFTQEIRMKVPHIAHDTNIALDWEHRAGCKSYQHHLKSYHDAKQRKTFVSAMLSFVSTWSWTSQIRTFLWLTMLSLSLKGGTISALSMFQKVPLIRNAKYLKHAPTSEVVTDSSESKEMVDP